MDEHTSLLDWNEVEDSVDNKFVFILERPTCYISSTLHRGRTFLTIVEYSLPCRLASSSCETPDSSVPDHEA